mmetsp:Transcript_26545/g.64706  ORF Transcript_26545/g.64706 Transcript_26545/m.64706 type:complete len:241 (-) Transcript_26545:350-1072(-)
MAIDERNLDALIVLTESRLEEELGRIAVWIDYSEDKHDIVRHANGLQYNICVQMPSKHVTGSYQTVKKFDSSSGEVVFAMNSNKLPHIALAEDEVHKGKMYEIVFTPKNDGLYRLRHDASGLKLEVAAVFHAGSMKAGDFRWIRISFDPTTVKIERYDDGRAMWEVLLEYNREKNDRAINFFRIRKHSSPVDYRVGVSSIHEAKSLATSLDSHCTIKCMTFPNLAIKALVESGFDPSQGE